MKNFLKKVLSKLFVGFLWVYLSVSLMYFLNSLVPSTNALYKNNCKAPYNKLSYVFYSYHVGCMYGDKLPTGLVQGINSVWMPLHNWLVLPAEDPTKLGKKILCDKILK